MTKPISLLRQRMIDDMKIRNMSMSTQDAYIRAVAKSSAFHRQSPNRLGLEHLRNYQLHLVSRGFKATSICQKMSALRFFYGTTLRRPDIAGQISFPRRSDFLPAVLAREGMKVSSVAKLLPLAFLAPDIVDAILAGDQSATIVARHLIRSDLPLMWKQQRAEILA